MIHIKRLCAGLFLFSLFAIVVAILIMLTSLSVYYPAFGLTSMTMIFLFAAYFMGRAWLL